MRTYVHGRDDTIKLAAESLQRVVTAGTGHAGFECLPPASMQVDAILRSLLSGLN
jgi:hypothetical protein